MASSLISSGYAILGLSPEIHLAQCTCCGGAMVDSIMGILICYGGCKANVHIVSEEVLGRIGAEPDLMRRIFKRYVKAWPWAKIKLGNTNFYDMETPLNLINFSFIQIVNLLLI